MKLYDHEVQSELVVDVAKKMLVAARTAPKTRGIDNLRMAILTDEDIKLVSQHLLRLAKVKKWPEFFIRDAQNLEKAQCLFIIGTKIKPLGLEPCGLCGFENCAKKPQYVPCAFNTTDLGIALGSAVRTAMQYGVDNRIMYTVGLAVLDLKILGNDVDILYAVPLSISGKNPFFDRKQH